MPNGGHGEDGVPGVQYLTRISEGLPEVQFHDGLAAVEVPYRLLRKLPLRNEVRGPGPRLERLLRSVRARGYQPTEPIICRIGRKGRWSVVDGGHRITAARIVGDEFWTNLFGPKVRTLYFLLFTTPRSFEKVRRLTGLDLPASPPPDDPDEPGDDPADAVSPPAGARGGG